MSASALDASRSQSPCASQHEPTKPVRHASSEDWLPQLTAVLQNVAPSSRHCWRTVGAVLFVCAWHSSRMCPQYASAMASHCSPTVPRASSSPAEEEHAVTRKDA